MSMIGDNIGTRYDDIVAYFKQFPFGTVMPDLTVLSLLPPVDRCLILERLAVECKVNLIVWVDKLSMAYLKTGWDDVAEHFLAACYRRGIIRLNQFHLFVGKISLLNVYGASESYDDTLLKLPQYESDGGELVRYIRDLCEAYRGRDVFQKVNFGMPMDMMFKKMDLEEFKNERMRFIHEKLGHPGF